MRIDKESAKLLLTQQQIAKRSGCSQAMVHYTINGDRVPSTETAIKLEKATGVCREAWVFPDRHWNPYIPFGTGQNCFKCPNYNERYALRNKMLANFLDRAPNKRKAFKSLPDLTLLLYGIEHTRFLILREITDSGLKLLCANEIKGIKYVPPKIIKYDVDPALINKVINRGHLVFQKEELVDASGVSRFLKPLVAEKAKSVFFVAVGRIFAKAVDYKDEGILTEEFVKLGIENIKGFDDAWKKVNYK